MLEPVYSIVLFVMCVANIMWHLSNELYLFVLLGCLYVDFKVRSVEGIILLTVVTGVTLDSGFTDRYVLFN